MQNAAEILEHKSLRVTPCRVFVLNEFLKKDSVSYSELDLEKKSKGNYDRVTIYRTLKTFIDQDILHPIFENENHVKYAFCKDHEHEKHNHEHVHFKCTTCSTTQCLDNVKVGLTDLPKGFIKNEANYLIIGICDKCNSTNQ